MIQAYPIRACLALDCKLAQDFWRSYQKSLVLSHCTRIQEDVVARAAAVILAPCGAWRKKQHRRSELRDTLQEMPIISSIPSTFLREFCTPLPTVLCSMWPLFLIRNDSYEGWTPNLTWPIRFFLLGIWNQDTDTGTKSARWYYLGTGTKKSCRVGIKDRCPSLFICSWDILPSHASWS